MVLSVMEINMQRTDELIEKSAQTLELAIDSAGGLEQIIAALEGTWDRPEVGEALASPAFVAEAMLAVAEASQPTQMVSVAEAVELAGGPIAIAEALTVSGGSVAEALEQAGGVLAVAEALSTPSRYVVLAEAS